MDIVIWFIYNFVSCSFPIKTGINYREMCDVSLGREHVVVSPVIGKQPPPTFLSFRLSVCVGCAPELVSAHILLLWNKPKAREHPQTYFYKKNKISVKQDLICQTKQRKGDAAFENERKTEREER